MLTFKEFLCEWSFTSKKVDRHMEKLGYKKLGNGVDQTAWAHPNDKDNIIKIFGTALDKDDRGEFTEGHLMFKWWVNYCQKHDSNPFLPNFEGWESFEKNDAKYLQIKMERLGKIPDDVGRALEGSLAYWGVQKNELYRKNGFRGVKNFNDDDEVRGKADGKRNDGVAQLMMLLGEKKFNLLFETIAELGKIGRKKGWDIDLHAGNFMYRNDGTPVIVDPFVI